MEEGPQDFPEYSDVLNAWYSPTSAKARGGVVYLSPTGEEVEITEISTKSTPCTIHVDLKFVGTVNKRKHVRDTIH